jgi:GNAT superfamily N-acetyltransferase
MINQSLRIIEEAVNATTLAAYASVSIAFQVETQFRCEPVEGGLGGIRLVEERVAQPYVKDYDAIAGEAPARWAKRWDTSGWRMFTAYNGDRRVGGCLVAVHSPGMRFLQERTDTAAIWDIRVAPDARGFGAGRALFEAAAVWAGTNAYRRLKIETQNVNVPASRFYARMGCYLGGVNRHAYSAFPDEVELIWYLEL